MRTGWRDVCRAEIGKPLQEAYGADVLALIGGLDWLIANLPRLLAPRRIPGEKRAHLQPMPYGVVGVIGTWNYPLLLDGDGDCMGIGGGQRGGMEAFGIGDGFRDNASMRILSGPACRSRW